MDATPVSPPVKSRRPRYFLTDTEKVLNVLVIVCSMLLIAAVSVEFFQNRPWSVDSRMFLQLQLWICVIFILDFFIRLFLAPKKWRYIGHNLIFLLVSVPFVNIAYFMDLHLSHEGYVILKLFPLIRGGYGVAVLVKYLTHSSVTSLFISYLSLLVSLTYFSSLLFYILERGVNTGVKDYADAIWWACMDVTTVGSNIYAVTPIGKILSVVLAATGMMMFPIFTVYITNKFQTLKKNLGEEQ